MIFSFLRSICLSLVEVPPKFRQLSNVASRSDIPFSKDTDYTFPLLFYFPLRFYFSLENKILYQSVSKSLLRTAKVSTLINTSLSSLTINGYGEVEDNLANKLPLRHTFPAAIPS